jgi:translocation and assembly module TamB
MARHSLLAAALLGTALAAGTTASAQFGWFGSGRNTAPASPSQPAPSDEKGVLASLVSRALSTPATRVSIGAVDGALSSDATIRDIQISDRDGVWLKLDRARIVWSRLALLQRRLQIDELTIGTLDIARKPIPAEGPVAGENEPILPELPVKVEVKGFKLDQLVLGEPILGTAARLAAEGKAKLGNDPQEGLDLTLDAKRLDRPGTLAVRLGLVPQGQKLDLTVKVDEPEGGLIARAGNIPGLPPVTLGVEGHGTLDAFDARLGFTAGDGIGANGNAKVARNGTARDLALDFEARIAGLLPEVAAPVFAGTTKLTGRTTIGDDGSITIPAVNLAAAAAKLDVSGSVKDGNADLTIAAENLPNQGGRTATAGAEIRRLAFRGRVVGPVAAPNVDATLDSEDASLPAGKLAKLTASFKTVPAGKDAAGKTRLDVTADARASGIAPEDPAIARALGDSLTLVLRGTADTGGTLAVERMNVATPTVGLRYAGTLGSDEMRGRLGISAENLRAFSDVAGLRLAGAANLEADLEGTPRAHRFNAKLDGNIAKFGAGIAALDGLFGGKLALGGIVHVEPEGAYRFEKLTLGGTHLNAQVDGTIGQESADLAVTGTLPDLKRADSRLSGRGTLNARVTGGIAKPNVVGEIAVADAAAMGRPIPRLAIGFDAKDVTGALDAALKLDGIVDGKPARGGLRVGRPLGGGTNVENLDLTIGSVKAKGEAFLDAANLARGRLSVDAPNLDDLSPLALQKLSGTVKADIDLDSRGGSQSAKVKAEALRVAAFGVTVSKADADLTVGDVYRRPTVAGRVAIDEASVGGEKITKVRLDAQGGATASDVTLTATARGFALDTKARVLPGDRTRVEVATLAASRGRDRLALAGPASVTIVDGGAELSNVALALGSGRLTLNGLVGSRLNLRAEAKAVPLSVADIVSPGLGLAGLFEGEARIEGTPSAPRGEYRAKIDGLSAPQIRSLNLGRIDVGASGRLNDGRASIDAAINAGRAGTLRIDGSVPAGGAGSLDVAIRGGLDAAAATTGLLAAGGRRLTGRVEIDARVRGTLDRPDASGSATLTGGTFTDATQGVNLGNIQARVTARGEELVVERGTASTRNGGTLTASGRVRLDPGAGFPGEIRLVGQNAELVRSSIATAVVNLNIALSGALARDPRVAGRIDITSAEVSIPERLPASLKPLPNTRHKNPTRTTRARLALDGQGKKGRAAPPFDAKLDLVLAVPGSIRVRGRGLNAQLGGSLRLGGTLAKPVANGGFDLQRGTLQVATARLDFSRGKLAFTGDLTPELDFVANTNSGGAAITVSVNGPADNPNFAFTSSPDLPQDEVLSRLLFNSPSGQLSAFQAVALAQAAAQFSGSDGAFEGLRRSLGLSGLDVGLGQGGLTGGLQRALGDRVSVGVRGGASAAQTGVGVDVRITDEIKVQGDVTANGGSSVGVGAQYEW